MAEISLRAYQDELDGLLREEKYDEVIAHSRHVLKSQPKNLRAYRQLGAALVAGRRWEEATDVLGRALGALPQDFAIHTQLARAFHKQGKDDRAIWHAERALDQKPNDQQTIDMIREQKIELVAERAEKNAEERLLQILMPPQKSDDEEAVDKTAMTREKLRQKLQEGKLDDRMVELDVQNRNNPIEVVTNQGVEEMDINIRELVPGLFGGQTRRRKMTVLEALDTLTQEEEQKLIDMEQITRMAVERTEQAGIVFLDEMDKIAGREGGRGPEVSREGVQRDLLPIVEGTTVNTRYGMIRTDHILFIAAGAFHVSKPSDMIPEMQGRFPIRVELKPLTKDDFIRILTEPKNALTKQYTALLETEGMKLEFTEDAIENIARTAMTVNEQTEDIGARRLHTVMEKLLEKISFEAPDMRESGITIDAAYVDEQLASIAKDQDLSRYIL
jgi:ATP-dependent HslUV protease ATP-binding subunit HslU